MPAKQDLNLDCSIKDRSADVLLGSNLGNTGCDNAA
jgi:hypothetical protein